MTKLYLDVHLHCQNEIIHVEAKLEEIPLFVKDGGIIPMIQPRLHAPENGTQLALEVRHYGKSEGEFLLYDDDGETFDYENGEYSWTKLSVEQTSDNQYTGNALREKDGIFNYKDISWRFMTE